MLLRFKIYILKCIKIAITEYPIFTFLCLSHLVVCFQEHIQASFAGITNMEFLATSTWNAPSGTENKPVAIIFIIFWKET